jgi:hypothetical protein
MIEESVHFAMRNCHLFLTAREAHISERKELTEAEVIMKSFHKFFPPAHFVIYTHTHTHTQAESAVNLRNGK